MKSFVLLIVVLLSFSLYSENKKITIFFANGMNTSVKSANQAKNAIIEKLTPEISGNIDIKYDLAYNRKENDLLQIAQVFEQEGYNGWKYLANPLIFSAVMPAYIYNQIQKVYVESDEGVYLVDADLARHIKQYKNELNEGRTVIVVAHSQGNFYANAAYEYFSDEDFHIVSVANPDNYVGGGGSYTTLTTDTIINLIRETVDSGTLSANTTNNTAGNDATGHDFIKSYLDGDVSGPQIIEDIVSLCGSAGYPNTVVDTINISDNPNGMAINPDGKYLYISGFYGDRILVIRTSDGKITDKIDVGDIPDAIDVTSDGEYAYVCNRNDDTVSVIKLSSNTVTDTIDAGNNSLGIAISPDNSLVWVPSYYDGYISVIRASDGRVVKTINIEAGLIGIDFTPDGKYAYVCGAYNHIYVIRTSDFSVIDTISADGAFYGIVISPDGEYAYASSWVNNSAANNTVSVIRTSDRSVIDIISVGNNPRGIGITPDGNYVYVCNHNDDNVSVIRKSDNGVVKTIDVGDAPSELAVSPDGEYVYVGNYNDASISVIGIGD